MGSPSIEELHTSAIQPLQLRRLVAGLSLDSTDVQLLKYLEFFAGKVSIERAAFLHVIPQFYVFQNQELMSRELEIQDAVEERMEKLLEESIDLDLLGEVELEIRHGDVLKELLAEINTQDADVALIGQDADTDVHGIKAKKMARRVSCNSLVIPSNATPGISRIMVPIDFSDHAAQALRTALAIQNSFGEEVEIICVHVYEMPYFAGFNIGKTEAVFNRMVKEDREEAFQAFMAEHSPGDATNISAKLIEKRDPRISNYLLKYAKDVGVDFVVMGAKGHSTVDLLMMGSVTESFLAGNEDIPVMIVRK